MTDNTKSISRAIMQAHAGRFPDGLVPPEQAAEILRLSPATLATMRSRQSGPPWLKSGSRVYYRIEDLAAWFAGRSIKRG